jgi:F-type H+-transporting ATPase subunit epsilon
MAVPKSFGDSLKLFIASSTGRHVEVETPEVYIETDEGELGVLPGHQPEFYSVSAGYVRFKEKDGGEVKKLVFNGFAQIEPDTVRIGAQEIYEDGEVDVSLVEREIEELKGKLSSLPEEEEEAKKKLEREISVRESLIRKAR